MFLLGGTPLWASSLATVGGQVSTWARTNLHHFLGESKKKQNKSGRGPFIAVMYECTAESMSGGDDWSRYMAVVVFDCKSMFPLCPRQCYVCALTINRCGRRDTVLFKNIHLYTRSLEHKWKTHQDVFVLENIIKWLIVSQLRRYFFIYIHGCRSRLIAARFSSSRGLISVAADWADRWLLYTAVICFREPPRGPAENAKHRRRL